MNDRTTRPANRTLLAVLSAAALLPAAALAAVQKAADQKPLSDRDLSKVAEAFADYEKAKAASKGTFEAQDELEKELGKAGKKLGGDGKSVDAMLKHPWSMSRAIWLSADYDGKASKQRKEPGKVTEQNAEEGVRFALWVPGKYKPKDGPYPVLLTIPDEGVKAETHIMEEWVEGEIRDTFLIAAPIMPGNAGEWLERPGIDAIMLTFRALRANFAIDFDRVFIGGRGRGVETAQTLAARFPDQFAGVFGWAGDAAPDLAPENFRNIPTYFAGGGVNAEAFKKAMEGIEVANVTMQQQGKAVDIAKWALEHRRDPYPTRVSIVQRNGSPTNAYWLQIPRIQADRVAIDAKIDRATNTITIEAEGVDAAGLLLNDALVDLDGTVTVIANGTETKFTERRKMSQSLDLFQVGRNDAGRYFVATRDVKIPAKPAPADAPGEKKDAGEAPAKAEAGRPE